MPGFLPMQLDPGQANVLNKRLKHAFETIAKA
jgi:hypothetical protein